MEVSGQASDVHASSAQSWNSQARLGCRSSSASDVMKGINQEQPAVLQQPPTSQPSASEESLKGEGQDPYNDVSSTADSPSSGRPAEDSADDGASPHTTSAEAQVSAGKDDGGQFGQRTEVPSGEGSACAHHVPVKAFLQSNDLAEYTHRFMDAGYDRMIDVCDMDNDDLTNVGMLKAGHQKRFKKAVEKYVSEKAAADGEGAALPAFAGTPPQPSPSSGHPLEPQECGKQKAGAPTEVHGLGTENVAGQTVVETENLETADRKEEVALTDGKEGVAQRNSIKHASKMSSDLGDAPDLLSPDDPVPFVASISKNLQKAQPMLEQVDGKDAVVLVGDTGVGKTTCFLFLAGCQVIPKKQGKDFLFEGVPEELAGSRVSDQACSVTDTITCWPAPAKEHPNSIWIDTPGHHDTRSAASDVTMSILIKQIAKRCSSLRFVCLLNMQCLLNRRGSTSRDALDTLRRWVPDLTSHLPAFSFIFTPATDPTVRRWTEEDVTSWRDCLRDQMQLVKDGSDWQPVWEWMLEDLQKEQPQFTQIFVPHLANRMQLVHMLLPANASSDHCSAGQLAGCIRSPGDLIQSGLSKDKEEAFRCKIQDVVETLEGCLGSANPDFAQVEGMMSAMQWIAGQVGTDLPFVTKAWDRAKTFVKKAVEQGKAELLQRIESGTSASMPVLGQGAVDEITDHMKGLDMLSCFGDVSAREDLQNFLDLRLEALHEEFVHRVDGHEGPQRVPGVNRTLRCLLAWQLASEKVKTLCGLCLQHLQALLSDHSVATLMSAPMVDQWTKVAVLRSLLPELEECPAAFHDLKPHAVQAMKDLHAHATSVQERVFQEANGQLQCLHAQPCISDMPEFLEPSTFTNAMKVVNDIAQVVKMEMLADETSDMESKLNLLTKYLTDGVELAALRVDAHWCASQPQEHGAEVTTESASPNALRADVLNMNAAVACLPSEMQDPSLLNLCREATSTAFKIWRWFLDNVHRELVKCEALQQLHEADAATLCKQLEHACAMEWLHEVDRDRGLDMQKEATEAKTKLLTFFHARVEGVNDVLSSFRPDLPAPPTEEQMATLKWGLTALKLIVRFDLAGGDELLSQGERMVHGHLQRITGDGFCEKLVKSDAKLLHTLINDGSRVEQLLCLTSLDWSFLQVSLPIERVELDETLKRMQAEVQELFSDSSHFQLKRQVIDGLMSWPPGNLTEKFPSCEELRAQLQENSHSFFKQGTEALASSPDWEEIVAECESNLNDMSLAFEDCKSFEGIRTQSLSWKTDLESKSKQKRSELNDQISQAIERLEFEQLRSYLERSPAAGPAHEFYMDVVSKVRECIHNRYVVALERIDDAPYVTETVVLLQRADQDIGSILRAKHDIDVHGLAAFVKSAMQSHCHEILAKLDKELRMEVGEIDIGAVVQRLSAVQLYWDAIENSGLGPEQQDLFAKLVSLKTSLNQQKQKVSALICSFFACINKGDPVKAGDLKSILDKALRQSSSAETQQLYDEWVQQLGKQLLDLHHVQCEVLANEHGDAGHCVRVCRALEEEWNGWLGNHLRSFSPCRNLNLSEAVAFAEKKLNEQMDVLRNEAKREELLAKLESLGKPSVLDQVVSVATSVVTLGFWSKGEPSASEQNNKRWHQLLSRSVDELLEMFMRHLKSRKVCAASGTLEVLLVVKEKFDKHLPGEQKRGIERTVDHVLARSVSVCKEISEGCTSGHAAVKLQELAQYVCYLWPAAQFGSLPTDLAKELQSMHQAVACRIERCLEEIDASCADEDIDKLQASLKQSRSLGWAIAGGFAVYAEDMESRFGKVESLFLTSALRVVQDTFTRGRDMPEIAKCLARLELPPDVTNMEEIKAKRNSLAMEHHPDKGGKGATEQQKKCMDDVMKRINLAFDTLRKMSDPGRSHYYHHLQQLHSEKVHEVLNKQVVQVKEHLQSGDYVKVKKILQELPKWQVLNDLVQPPLNIDKLEEIMGDAVESHALLLSEDAHRQMQTHHYKSLSYSLVALGNLKTTFGASRPHMRAKLSETLGHVRGSVSKQIQESADHARASLESPSDMHMHSLAEDLIKLRVIGWEMRWFASDTHQQIGGLLAECLSRQAELGTGYLLKLGLHLSKVQDSEGPTAADTDGTVDRGVVARSLVDEFPQFSIVQNMLWNSAVEKMQKDPRACVEDVRAKKLIGDVQVGLDKRDLEEGLQKYKTFYDGMLDEFVRGTLSQDDVISRCLHKVDVIKEAIGNDISASGLEVIAKTEIPELLAYIFIHYTMASAGEGYKELWSTGDGQEEETSHLEQGLKTPHNIQVLAVLRLFGFGSKKPQTQPARLDNHLVQVRTGEGKSLILGGAATLFALLGFRVRCICYSAYLSRRDKDAFASTFAGFEVAASIKYSQIINYSDDTLTEQGDIRSLTMKLLTSGGAEAEPSTAALAVSYWPDSSEAMACQGDLREPRSEEVLLIDEVDVLWGEDFYGKTYNPVIRYPCDVVRRIFQSLWDWRECGYSTDQLMQKVEACSDYSKLLSMFPSFEYVIRSEVARMCRSLHDFKQGSCRTPIFDKGDGGRIGYKKLDGVSFDTSYGYSKAFAYLEHKAGLQPEVREEKLDSALSLSLRCGQFSYSNITPKYIFGVSGTVQQLDDYQRSEIAKHNLTSYTIVPSVYGALKFCFLDQRGNPIKVCETRDFHHEIGMDIKEKIHEGRAIIVFFADAKSLNSFRKSSYCAQLPAYEVLEETLSHSAKQHCIKKAATSIQITLATAIFGRGSDFACYDEKLQKNGGLHVLQTFVSLDVSEEAQIQGRTARQGKTGTYSLILKREDIQELGLEPSALKDQSPAEKHKRIRQACTSQQSSKFDEMRKKMNDATDRDRISRAYFRAVLGNDIADARLKYKAMYDKIA